VQALGKAYLENEFFIKRRIGASNSSGEVHYRPPRHYRNHYEERELVNLPLNSGVQFTYEQ
jgi:hypothetical protein